MNYSGALYFLQLNSSHLNSKRLHYLVETTKIITLYIIGHLSISRFVLNVNRHDVKNIKTLVLQHKIFRDIIVDLLRL